MKIKLGWITVKDLQQAKEFYTNLGLTIKMEDVDNGWLELEDANKSFSLGIWQEGTSLPLPGKAGTNTIMTFYVNDIVSTKQNLEDKGVTFTSSIYTLPSTVRIADFIDADGNQFQLVQE